MMFFNDWIGLALVLGFVCAGFVAGRRLGVIAAWWLAGGLWLAFRLADAVWKPVVVELRASNPDMNLVTAIPLTYGLLFFAGLMPTLILLGIVRPKSDFKLPGDSHLPLGVLGGLVAGGLLFLAGSQAHIMHPVITERMTLTHSLVRPVLSALGQQNIGSATPVTPASAAPVVPARSGG
jgi:hypothetical protein